MNRLILISFLGTGNYEEVTYNFSGSQCKTEYFPHAMKTFFENGELHVFLTEEAERKHGENLRKKCEYAGVKIPLGKSENEMWSIFGAITEQIPISDGDELILDVTHGFRTQPMLALAAISFLKAMKEVNIKHILYGALDAKTEDGAPVFDLLPFLDIMEWSFSLRQFNTHGDMKTIGERLVTLHKQIYQAGGGEKPKTLQYIGKTLMNLTEALDTIRVEESMKCANKFVEGVQGLTKDLANHVNTKPFSLMMSDMITKVKLIAVSEEDVFLREGLNKQKEIIRYYILSGHYQQAVTLMREFIVTAFMVNELGVNNKSEIISKEKRKESEDELNKMKYALMNKEPFPNKHKFYVEIWNRLIDVRNDINHGSMKEQVIESYKLIGRVKKINEEIQNKIMVNIVN